MLSEYGRLARSGSGERDDELDGSGSPTLDLYRSRYLAGYRYGDPDGYSNRYADANSDMDSGRTYGDSDGYADADADGNRNGNRDIYGNGYADSDRYGYGYGDTDSRTGGGVASASDALLRNECTTLS